MDKQHILDEIRRTACDNGGDPPGMRRFLKETGIRVSDWRGRFWATWREALEEAGYSRNPWNAAYGDGYLLEQLAELIKELGKFPTYAEQLLRRRQHDQFPSAQAFRRLGNKRELAAAIAKQYEAREGYEDVVSICRQLCGDDGGAVRDQLDTTSETFAFVYLMKAGKFYKIGLSNSAERREYELRIQMPEKLCLVHKIKTDDPTGIEEYWHKRFAGSRKNGEWFELTAQEVSAFKRRTFM